MNDNIYELGNPSNDPDDRFQDLTLAERREIAQEVIDQMVANGELYDTGKRRNGDIIYAKTEWGKIVSAVAPDDQVEEDES